MGSKIEQSPPFRDCGPSLKKRDQHSRGSSGKNYRLDAGQDCVDPVDQIEDRRQGAWRVEQTGEGAEQVAQQVPRPGDAPEVNRNWRDIELEAEQVQENSADVQIENLTDRRRRGTALDQRGINVLEGLSR
jgi:hypothetical protein